MSLSVDAFFPYMGTILTALITSVLSTWIINHIYQSLKEQRDKRLHIFRTLMATRQAILDSEHIIALNLIDVDFYQYSDVINAYRDYRNKLGEQYPANLGDRIQFETDKTSLFYNLLRTMAHACGYSKMNEYSIQKSGFMPNYFASKSENEHNIRQGLISLLEGKCAINMNANVTDNRIHDSQEPLEKSAFAQQPS